MSALKTILGFSDQHNLGWSRETAVQVLDNWACLVGTFHLAPYAKARAEAEGRIGSLVEADQEGTSLEADDPMTVGDYLAHHGLRCPYCKSRDQPSRSARALGYTGQLERRSVMSCGS